VAISKATRLQVYNKYSGHCAYCGKAIEYKNMQEDHIVPKRIGGSDDISNKNPSCRRCNHYKRARSIEKFRELLLTLHKRVQNQYICKVAEDYGIIKIEPWNGRFYFEKHMFH
jgi:5-methylcytosine-specific restriction endonuclease McrA